MSWTDLEPPARRSTTRRVGLSANESKLGHVGVLLTVALSTLAEIGTPEDRYALRLGVGGEAGWLLLIKDGKGRFKPTLRGKGQRRTGTAFYLGECAFAPDGKQRRTECHFELNGNALRIKLPKWAFTPDAEEDPEAAPEPEVDAA